MSHDRFDLERELRASRPQPRGDYAKALADEVRGRPAPEQTRQSRLGLVLALSGLIVVAVASFGGIGYASSKNTPNQVWVIEKPNSAAAAQYCPPECTTTTTTTTSAPTTSTPTTTEEVTVFTPPVVKNSTKATFKPPKTNPVEVAGGAAGGAPTAPSSGLPFTGLALWVPLAIGLLLLATGIVLRTRGRRGGSGAHS